MQRLEKLLPIFAGLVAAAAPTYLLRFSIDGIPTTVLEILIYLFVAAVVATQSGRFRPIPRAILWPTILFIIAAITSTIIAPDKRAALGILKAWIIDPMLFAWAIYQLQDRKEVTRSVITGLIAGGLTVAAIAIVQRFTGQVTVDGRVTGPYGWFPAENASPNYLALYLAPLTVLTAGIGAGVIAAGRRRGWLIVLGAILMALAIYFSFSRGGLGAVAVGIASVLVLQFWEWIRRRLWIKIALIGVLIALIIGGWAYIRPAPSLSPEEGGRITASNNVRWEIWRTTVREVIPNKPLLGVGLGNFQNYFTELTRGRVNYDRIAPLALTPHNLFLALWVNLGLLGLVAMIWLLYEFYRTDFLIVNEKESEGEKERRGFSLPLSLSPSLAAVGAMTTLLAHGLLDTPYFKNDLSLLFWTLIVLMVSLTGNRQTTP